MGVAWQKVEWWLAMQFIFADGSRTKALDSGLDPTKWKEEVFPSDCPLTRVQLVYDREHSIIVGIRFADPFGMSVIDLGQLDKHKNNGH